MCIVPGQAQILIPPTGKASIVAHYLRLVVLLHFVCAVLAFCSVQIIPGVFDMLGSFLGFLALRKKEGYVYQQVICYTLLCAIRFITSLITVAIGYSQADLGLSHLATWQFWLCIVLWVMQPFVFASGASLGWLLHTELRKVVQEMQAAMGGGGDSGGGGLFGLGGSRESERQVAAEADAGGSYQAPLLRGGAPSSSASAAEQQPGFRAFAGQGHRLGGT